MIGPLKMKTYYIIGVGASVGTDFFLFDLINHVGLQVHTALRFVWGQKWYL
jgi:hypothetical protein